MKLVKSKFRNRYWVEDRVGKKVTPKFEIYLKYEYGTIMEIIAYSRYPYGRTTYVITNEDLYEAESVRIDKVDDLYYTMECVLKYRDKAIVYNTYDINGNLILRGSKIYPKNEGLRKVVFDGKIGYMDEKLNIKIWPNFLSEKIPFTDGIAMVESEPNVCIAINKEGKTVGNIIECSSVELIPNTKLIKFTTEKELKGIADIYGKIIIPAKYHDIIMRGEYFELVLNDLVGLADSSGKIILECIYDRLIEFDDRFIVRELPIKTILRKEIMK